MRRIMYTAVVIFWSSVATIWVISVLSEGQPAETDPSTDIVVTPDPGREIGSSELARHDRPEDCWIAVDGRVYDISDYIPDHPTPADIVTRWCGRDATEAYRSKGYGAAHSAEADALLEGLAVGRFVDG